MSVFLRSSIVFLSVITAGFSQPVVSPEGIANSASYLPSCAANGFIARGSVFVIFGTGLGPTSLQQVSRFPLETTLGGTSVRISVNGTTVDAFPLYTSARQVAALLPSRTPVGTGTLTVSFGGRTSATVPIRVGQSAFGIYTLNQAGTGSAVAQIADNISNPLQTVSRPSRPGDALILWGTGLGPVDKDEAAGALPNEPRDIRPNVWVGGRQAGLLYAGRSGCCAGIDQIVFTVPDGVEGCNVPVAVEIGGTYSNYTTISVARQGQPSCPDPTVSSSQATPNFSLGIFVALRLEVALSGLPVNESVLDVVNANFARGFVSDRDRAALESMLKTADLFTPGLSAGNCIINPPSVPPQIDPGTGAPDSIGLDAGSEISVTGPTTVSLRLTSAGSYGTRGSGRLLGDGHYRVANGAGGKDVGPVSFEYDFISPKLVGSFPTISRSQDLQVRWTAPVGAKGVITFSGSSTGACGQREVSFSCVADVSAGQMVVPRAILSQMPASQSGSPFSPGGSLTFSASPVAGARTFTARGVDLGLVIIGYAQILATQFQ